VERPRRLVRTAVATREGTEAFGWMAAAEAARRGFYQAPHRAIVGDGGNWIEPLGQMHFPGWVQVLDFLHLLVHLYAAATAAHRGQGHLAWRLYERMLRAAWSGKVEQAQALCSKNKPSVWAQPRPRPRKMILAGLWPRPWPMPGRTPAA
jgi:hypothetical protein